MLTKTPTTTFHPSFRQIFYLQTTSPDMKTYMYQGYRNLLMSPFLLAFHPNYIRFSNSFLLFVAFLNFLVKK